MRNWRSYRDATVELDRPVVFFVAPNGVGKTSLVDAARRCLLGFPRGRGAGRAVRAGEDQAELSVDLVLGGIDTITVSRTLTRTGRTTFTAERAGASLSEEEFLELLSREWASDLALLDRLMFGDANLSSRAGEALPVREHLADLLGVTSLLGAVTDLRSAKGAVSATIGTLRTEVADTDSAISEAEGIEDSARLALERLTADREHVHDALRAAEATAQVAAEWERFRADAASYNLKVADLLAEIGEMVSVDPAEPHAGLDRARTTVEAELATARQASADADLAAARATGASELLANPTDVCPTCLRPLSEAERAFALHAHGDAAIAATSGSAQARRGIDRVETHLRAITEFSRRLDRLQPPAAPAVLDPGLQATADLENARAADALLAEQIGEARARLDAASVALTAARQGRADVAVLERAAREELLLDTTAEAFEQLADRYLRERIEPLRRDIEYRWKLVFGVDGLELDPNGGMRLHQGDTVLEAEDMSGGERAVAGIIVRLLVAGAVTRIPTLWFDEPLEHLDPRRRVGIARTLMQAAAAGTIRQVVATTYEEGIARRLAQASPDLVAVVYADNDPSVARATT